ncbi:MAG: hypothetical protein HZB57_11715 [Gammaproteobacteria bacterium]|nr:hypothetical protein [Gammaproteobacteria bacterium]
MRWVDACIGHGKFPRCRVFATSVTGRLRMGHAVPSVHRVMSGALSDIPILECEGALTLERTMFWFGKKNKEITAFARFLAEEFFSNLPPNLIEKQNDKTDQKGARSAKQRFESALDDIVSHAKQFKQQKNLKVYGKAKFHLEFAARLKSLGYDAKLVNEINHAVMVRSP